MIRKSIRSTTRTAAVITGLTLAALSGPIARAGETPDIVTPARAAIMNLEGTWRGVLEYRDYRSDKLVAIPHERTIRPAPDGSYLLMQMSFTDPGYRVHSVEIMTFDGSVARTASAGNGQVETGEADLSGFEAVAGGWRAELRGRGMDDGKPADILHIWQRTGEDLMAERQVRPDGTDAFTFRNRVRLSRTE